MTITPYKWVVGDHYIAFDADDDLSITMRIKDDDGIFVQTVDERQARFVAHSLVTNVLGKIEPGTPEDAQLERLLAWLATVRDERARRTT